MRRLAIAAVAIFVSCGPYKSSVGLFQSARASDILGVFYAFDQDSLCINQFETDDIILEDIIDDIEACATGEIDQCAALEFRK